MITLERCNSIAVAYQASIDGKRIGEIALQDDGSYAWWPYQEPGTPGYWSAAVLRQVAEKLKELSAPALCNHPALRVTRRGEGHKYRCLSCQAWLDARELSK